MLFPSSRSSFAILAMLTLLALPLLAPAQTTPQNGQSVPAQPLQQRSPVVEKEVHHDVSLPLFSIPPAARQTGLREHDVEILPRAFHPGAIDPVVQQSFPTILAPVPLLNFDGVGNGFTGPGGTFTVNSAPPDTDGDVGPNHFVQIVNSDFAIFNKTGTAIFGPVPTNTLWSGFGGLCQTDDDGDGVAVYDPIADRWIISQFAVSGANGTTVKFLQCVAVSQTPDPTGAYNRYSFAYSSFNDYPKIGVWPDAYYMTFNFFNAAGTAFQGGEVCAYDRAKMLVGQAATQQCFNVGTSFGGLLPADLDGPTLPPSGSPNYVLALGISNNDLAFWKFHVDWTTPASTTLTGPTTITIATYSEACNGGTCIPQSGTTQLVDSLADRLMYRLAYRNFGTHETLVANHSVTAGTSTGVRWYEIRSPATTPTIFQQGTYAPDSNYRWMGSIAMDQNGDMALGFSLSSSSLHPEIHYTGRLATDPAGQMSQGEGTFINGAGSQTGGLTRWGDYSFMGVDPTDDCTFWYTQEYIPSNGKFNWSTRVGTFKFPGCGGVAVNDFSISANPTSLSLAQGAGSNSTISTAVASGTAETITLSVSGVPSGATTSLSPSSITAGNSSTLNVNAGTAALGTYPLMVTGTAPSATHSTTVTLTVTSSTAPSLSSISPNNAVRGAIIGVTLTGTNLTGAAINALSGITISNVSATATQVTATFAIATGAPLGAQNVTVTTGNGTSNPVSFTVNAAPGLPTLTNTTPGYVVQSTSPTVTLTGTNFVPGNTTVNNTYTGLSISNVVVVSSTSLTATFTVTGTAPAGTAFLTVTTPSGTSTNKTGIDVIGVPVLNTISPNNGNRSTAFTVTLSGLEFLRAQLSFSGTGITATNRVASNGFMTLTYTFTIASNAPFGPQSVTLTNPAGTSAPVTFTVNGGTPAPTLTNIAPTFGTQGQVITPVTLTGTNLTGATINALNGVSVSNVVAAASSVTATFTIAANAPTGAQNVTVTTGGGTSNPVTFTVNQVPAITSANSATFVVGTLGTFSVIATGFPTPSLSESGALPTGVAFVDNHNGTGTLSGTPATGTAGPYPISFTAANTAGSTPQSFTLTVNTSTPPTPTLSTINPTSGRQGQVINPVTLTGTNLSGATINALSGITISNVVATATQVTATFTIAANAALGAQNVNVTTAGGPSNSVPFTVNPPLPVLSTISPNNAVRGAIIGVTLTGTNLTGAAINALSGITISNVSATATQVTATFAIATGAPLGAQNVTVTTGNGTSNPVSFTVNAAPGLPTLTNTTPGYVVQSTSPTVTLTGTNFVPGNTTVNNTYTGLSISNVVVVSSTSLTATFTVTGTAPAGTAFLTVTTPSGTSTNKTGIDVIGVPVLNTINPANGSRGTAFTVTLSGSEFIRAQISFSGTGITATNRVVSNGFMTVTYTFTIASNAPFGPQSVTLTNPAGTSAPVTFTVQ